MNHVADWLHTVESHLSEVSEATVETGWNQIRSGSIHRIHPDWLNMRKIGQRLSVNTILYSYVLYTL